MGMIKRKSSEGLLVKQGVAAIVLPKFKPGDMLRVETFKHNVFVVYKINEAPFKRYTLLSLPEKIMIYESMGFIEANSEKIGTVNLEVITTLYLTDSELLKIL